LSDYGRFWLQVDFDGNSHKVFLTLQDDPQADKWQEIAKLWIAAPRMVTMLSNIAEILEVIPSDGLGIGGKGITHCYIRDELLGQIRELLEGEQ